MGKAVGPPVLKVDKGAAAREESPTAAKTVVTRVLDAGERVVARGGPLAEAKAVGLPVLKPNEEVATRREPVIVLREPAAAAWTARSELSATAEAVVPPALEPGEEVGACSG